MALIRSSKRVRAAAGAVVAFAMTTIGLVAIGVATSAPAGAAPSMTVTPSTGLSDGQTVTVHGTGYTANAKNLNVIQCPVSGAGQNTCDISDAKLFQTIGADGSWTVTMKVKAKIGSIDCSKVACMIDGHEGTSETSGNDGSVVLHFGASAGSTGTGSGSGTGTGSGGTGSTGAGSTGTGSTGTGSGSGTGSGGTGSSGTGGQPTGAPTGREDLGAPRVLLALVLAGAGVLLLAGGTALHLRRRANT